MKKVKYICPFCKKKIEYNKDKNVFYCKKCDKELLQEQVKIKRRRPSVFMIILLVVLIIIAFNKVYDVITRNKIYNNQAPIKDTYSEIINDFNNKEISADECAKQMYNSLYYTSNLKDKYNSINNINSNNLIDFIDKNYENISEQTLLEILKKIFMSDVYIGEKEPNFSISNMLNFNAVYATTDEMRVLDKVKLSNDGNFLIWYTTTGKDKVSEKNIEDISNSIDLIIEKIEKDFNLQYIYSAKEGFSGNDNQLNNMKSILKKNGISESYLDTAMNVYVVDSGTTPETALAQYLQSFTNLEKIMVKIAQSTDKNVAKSLEEVLGVPILPYFNIKPKATQKNEDLNLICAHELTHHFQRYIAGNGKIGNPKAGNFTTETVSNYVAASIINAKSADNCISDHASIYVSKCDEKLDTIGSGYAAVSFAKVYEEIVSDGKQKVLNSVLYKDTLKYFYDVSDGKFDEVMQTLAIRNITNEYDNNTFKSSILPKNRKDLSVSTTEHSDTINPVAIHYYYLNSDIIKDNVKVSVKLETGNLSYILVGKQRNKYVEIGKYNIDNSVDIDIYTLFDKYDEIVVGIVNSSLNETIKYNIEKKEVLINEENGVFELVDFFEFQVKDFFDLLINMIDFSLSFINEVEKTGVLEEVTDEVNTLNEEANLAKNEINSVANENNKNVKFSQYNVLPSSDYNYIHDNINDYLLGGYLKVFEQNIEGCRITFGVSINDGVSIYILATSNTPKEGVLLLLQLQ